MLLLSLAALLSSCAAEGNDKKQDLIVKTTQAVPVSHQGDKEFSFIARPFRTSELSFRVGGPIDRFDVYAGNRYQQGSIIAEIDPRDFRIRKERAEAIYHQAKTEFERIQKLYDKGNISASAYEKAKADYTTAKTAFDTASYELEDTRLIAPFIGYVGEVYIEKFQDVKATQPVISFIDIDQLKLEIYVTQDIAYTAQAMDTIQVRFDAQPDKVYNAKIMEISKGTTRNNLSYLLTAIVPNPDMEWLGGMSGILSIDLPKEERSQNLWLPLTAICHRPQKGDYVWVVKGDKVNSVPVKLGEQRNNQIEIVEGITENDLVVLTRQRFLSENSTVTIQK